MTLWKNLVVALVAAFVLAACSSSSDTSSTTPDPGPTEEQLMAQVTALQNQINALRMQLGLEADDNLSDSITDLQDQVTDLTMQLKEKTDAEEAARKEAERLAAEANAATAAKLYAGIGADPLGGGRAATSDAEGAISVTTATGETAVVLSEDKMTMVPDNHGWMGKRHTDPPGGASIEAVVYSDVGDPTEGDPFDEEYTLAEGLIADVTTVTDYAGLVASPSFDQSAGTKSFELPTNTVAVMISGTFHGVAGTYGCTPTNADTDCSATVAASGFTLAGGTWTFKPANAKSKVMSAADIVYASYGWWIHKAANDGDFTASAFVAERGDVPAATGVTALRGTATYMGGAAGKYALSSSTGGTNDAGHFTARATLEADFNDDMISGTIDMFMGADGMARDWSVALNETDISDGGVIDGLGGDANDVPVGTAWTIGGTAAAKSGGWSGSIQDNGDDGVPKVASGTFYTEYGTAGRMVGAFGANKQ